MNETQYYTLIAVPLLATANVSFVFTANDGVFRFELDHDKKDLFPESMQTGAPGGEKTEEELTALRDAANEEYCYRSDNDVEVDDEPHFSRGEDGTWVSGWLWIADPPLCSVCDEPITAAQTSVEKDGGEIHLECEPLYDTDAEDDEDNDDDEPECGECVTCGAQCVSGGEGSVICPVCDQSEEDQRVASLTLVRTVARMTPDPEAEDAIDTVNSLIARARAVIA